MAAVTNLATVRSYRAMSTDGLWLHFVAASATVEAVTSRCASLRRDPTPQEDEDLSTADEMIAETRAEFRRRLQSVLGGAVTLDDLIMRGAI